MSEFFTDSHAALDAPVTPGWEGPETEGMRVHRTYGEMVAYVESGDFHSEQDRQIATAFATGLRNAYLNRVTDYQTYDTAMTSLGALVPVTGEDGRRRIAGKPLSKATERWVASRLESPEVDLTGPEGAWGKLPKAVRDKILAVTPDLNLEMTANCTAACSFCVFADKGEISSKASFESVQELIREFDAHSPRGSRVGGDSLYHGTDPFDIKWKTPQGNELDYQTIANYYADTTQGRRGLGTSTAVPIGEEFRVLYFANWLMGSGKLQNSPIRLSKSSANADRVDHVVNVLKGLGPIDPIRFIVHDLRGMIALRGSAWKRIDRQIDRWDIMGPNCVDGVVISPNKVTSVFLQGASPEQPNGDIRFPLDDDLGDGTHVYVVPVQYNKPAYSVKKYYSGEIYPDPQVWKFTYDGDQQREPAIYGTVARTPHRALLRLMGAVDFYKAGEQINGNSADGAQADFRKHFTGDVEIVQNYLLTRENVAMERALDMLTELRYIS